MENQEDDKQEAEQAIQKVKQLTNDQNVLAGVQALLNLIPFAGGTLSSILSEYRSRRTTKRIFDTISELRETIEDLGTEKQNILNPDEVIEIMHNALEEIAKTSSEEKLRYLRNCLTKSFTAAEIAYSQKELYLSMLIGLSLGELDLLKEIYLSSDTFVQTYPKKEPSSQHFFDPNVVHMNISHWPKQYKMEYKEPSTGETLQEVLQKRLKHISKGTLEGLIDILDARGLSKIRPNLSKRTIKIMTETNSEINQLITNVSRIDAASIRTSIEKPIATPIEASRTQFGEAFIQYIQSKQ